jgi:hypothetical protein
VSGLSTPSFPASGVGIDGERRDVAVDELIYIYGRRTPDHTVAPHGFRFAFVLVTAPGGPQPGSLEKVDRFRREFEAYFARVTDHRAVAETTMGRNLTLSASPAAGVVAGASLRINVAIEKPRETPLTVLLAAPLGFAAAPPDVVIPEGETGASFELTGVSPGVEELIAVATDEAYSSARARIQVTSSPAVLQLRAASGAGQTVQAGTPLPAPIVVELVDVNGLPYPGITIRAQVREGDTLTPDSAVTDAHGRVEFHWTPGVVERRDMLITSEGVPDLWVSLTATP